MKFPLRCQKKKKKKRNHTHKSKQRPRQQEKLDSAIKSLPLDFDFKWNYWLTLQALDGYLPCTVEMVTLFTEHISKLFCRRSSPTRLLLTKNAGFISTGRGELSFANIATTCETVGLSSEQSSTHAKPTWVNLRNCSFGNEPSSVWSASSRPTPLCHSSHACNGLHFLQYQKRVKEKYDIKLAKMY